MLETLAVGLLVVFGLVLVPLFLILVVGKVLLALLLLPFRLAGAVIGVTAGVVGAVAKLLILGVGAIVGVGFMLGGLVLLPLIPIAGLVLLLWLFVRLFAPGPRIHPA